jgi:ANTAR domain-containing protein/GAF domain-containing protein
VDANQADRLVIALRTAALGLVTRRSIEDLEATLGQIVLTAVETVPCVDAGSISLTRHGVVETRQPTAHEIGELDRTQGELGEGPCITALTDPADDGVVLAQDLAGEDAARWPKFAPQAVAFGIRSLMSTQLCAAPNVRAALNLYSRAPHAFDERARRIAGLFGIQAGVLLYGSDRATHLKHAIDSRDVIGQAKGVLMTRFAIDDDQAFRMLVSSSQETNLKLVDISRWLAAEAAQGRSQPTEPARNTG